MSKNYKKRRYSKFIRRTGYKGKTYKNKSRSRSKSAFKPRAITKSIFKKKVM